MVNCPYKGDETMIKRTYEIWQISAETILANAKQREDGTYRIHFDVEKAVHNESVRKTEQPQCALFDQIEHIFNEPDFPEIIRGLRRMEWHIVYVDFSGSSTVRRSEKPRNCKSGRKLCSVRKELCWSFRIRDGSTMRLNDPQA